MASQSLEMFEKLGLKHNVTKTSSGAEVHSYTSDLGPDTPVMTMVHGYPQSAYEWRYLVPMFIKKVSLFVPELPGYGISSACNEHSKQVVGGALLEALQAVFNIDKTPRKVILGGHDRGARICHRLAVDRNNFPKLDVLGAVMLDIVPTTIQWQAFSDPTIACGYFHWPLLANAEMATDMIKAYGPAKWVRGAHTRIGGTNKEGQQRIMADGAVEVYEELFSKQDTVYYSCLDYASGAAPEASAQNEDQKNDRKVDVPTLVMFSKAKLGARQDVENIWRNWVKPGVPYQGVGVGEGYGHYLPEEAPKEVSEAISAFLDRIL